MLAPESLTRVNDIIANQRQPKKRISKACIKCKNSKNKCINIEKGVCERCIELNEICIYDYSHATNQEDSKVLVSKEYLTLLQNKSMLCELLLKKMFNNFDKLVGNGFIAVNEQNRVSQSGLTAEEQLWTTLIRENHHFCNPGEVNTNFNHMTAMYKSNLEINPLIQMVLPNELEVATKTLNSINGNHVTSVFNDREAAELINKTHQIVLSNPEQKKKRRRISSKSDTSVRSMSPKQPAEPTEYHYITPSHSNSSLLHNHRTHVLPTLATIGIHSNGPTPTNSPKFQSPDAVSRIGSMKPNDASQFKLPPLKLPPARPSFSHYMHSELEGNQTLVYGKDDRSKFDLKMILNND